MLAVPCCGERRRVLDTPRLGVFGGSEVTWGPGSMAGPEAGVGSSESAPRACTDHRREAGPIAEAGLSESMFMPGPVPGGLESSGGVWDVRVITRSEVLAEGLVGPVLGDWAVPVGIRDEPGMTVGGGPRAPYSRGTSSKATQAYRQGGYSDVSMSFMILLK